MNSWIKKSSVGGLFVLSLATYALYLRSAVPATADGTPASVAEAAGIGTLVPGAKYRDGTYTGDETDAYYGFIKVSVTVSGGKMTAINFLEYPDDESESRRINQEAIPVLTEEALTSQGTDGISGTTRSSQTTEAFIQSLASALAKAEA